MTPLQAAAWLALLTAAMATAVASLSIPRRRLEPWARRALLLAAGAAVLPLALLAWHFLTTDLSLFYVWQNTRADYPWWLRLAGIWGGQQGTFLLWGALVTGAAAIEARWAPPRSWPPVRALLLLVATLLLVMPVMLGLGQATMELGLTASGFEVGAAGPTPLDVRPDGEGLNPLLESPYMAIHPVVEFVAYALTALPATYALVHLATGRRWREPARRWARAAWVVFLAALALGALWAYNVLSFGGYWAWDPVETADLLPFLALTALLHALPVQRRTGHLGLAAPALASLTLVLVVFATFVTRSGLWSSVHAFLPSGLQLSLEDPGARLVRIVAVEPTARATTGLLVLVSGGFAAAVSRYHGRHRRGGEALAWNAAAGALALLAVVGLVFPVATTELLHGLALLLGLGTPLVGAVVLVVLGALPVLAGLSYAPSDAPLSPRTRTGQLTLATYALIVLLVATLLLLVLGVNGYDRSVYDARSPYLAGAVLTLVTLAFWPGRPRDRSLAAGAGVAGSVLVRAITGSWAWAAAPLALVAAAGPSWRYVQRGAPPESARGRAWSGLVGAAGALALVHWASPGLVQVGPAALSMPAWYAPVGLAAGAAALAAPFLATHRRRWIGPLAGFLGVGYGAGALLALAALAVAPPSLGRSAPVRTAGVPLLHVGLALLVLAVSLSTFGQTLVSFPQGAPLERGVPAQVGPYTIELVDGHLVERPGTSVPALVEAVVHVRRDGVFLSEERLRLEHHFGTGFTTRGGFVPHDSPVTRTWSQDVVLDSDPATPLSIRLRDTNATWAVANAPPPAGLGGRVDAVSLGVAITPAAGLLWGSIALMAVGAGLRWLPQPAWTLQRAGERVRDPQSLERGPAHPR